MFWGYRRSSLSKGGWKSSCIVTSRRLQNAQAFAFRYKTVSKFHDIYYSQSKGQLMVSMGFYWNRLKRYVWLDEVKYTIKMHAPDVANLSAHKAWDILQRIYYRYPGFLCTGELYVSLLLLTIPIFISNASIRLKTNCFS